MIFQIHYPQSENFSIKYKNKTYMFKHNELVTQKDFFKFYPHIFKPRPDIQKELDVIKNQKDSKEFFLVEVSKGWFEVHDNKGTILKTKCRKKAAEKFIHKENN